MFPPETMQTTLPVPALPGDRGRGGERAGALGDHADALGDQAHGGGGVVERDRERAVEQLGRLLPHARDQRAAARAVDERAACTRPRPARPSRASRAAGAPVSGSAE